MPIYRPVADLFSTAFLSREFLALSIFFQGLCIPFSALEVWVLSKTEFIEGAHRIRTVFDIFKGLAGIRGSPIPAHALKAKEADRL